ncbi:MAG: NAD(P)H-hydrate dehydratase [bacterium]
MENAGRHVARAVAERIPTGAAVAVCVGVGNNGGDGSVAARHLLGWGYAPILFLCGEPGRVQGDARVMLDAARAAGVPVRVLDTVSAFAEAVSGRHFDAVVDALLGTGARGEVGGVLAEAIAWINAQPGFTVAVDIPSGLCGRTGAVLGQAVAADETITFVASKLGLWLGSGPALRGRLRVVDIGMPPLALAGLPSREVLARPALAPAFASRRPDAHKGDLGHVLAVAGSPGRTGAARLVVEAAQRAGAGLVTVALPSAAHPLLAPALCEAMYLDAFPGTDVEAAAAALLAEIATRDAVVLGPGMPTTPFAGEVLRALLPRLARPAVLDADALNHLGPRPEQLRGLPALVITPHPGEAARLLGSTAAQVQADRLGAATTLAERTGAVTVLKGAHTLVASPGGSLALCPAGNPGMATAGMGDVLAGVIGALLARGLDPEAAARAGVLWHARAGDRARAHRGEGALIARDVVDALAEVERAWHCAG